MKTPELEALICMKHVRRLIQNHNLSPEAKELVQDVITLTNATIRELDSENTRTGGPSEYYAGG